MATRAQKVKLGVFVVASAVAIALMAIAFVSMPWFDRRVRYHVFAEDVKGLYHGSPVYLRGVHVGQVESLDLGDSRQVRVNLAIAPEVAVPAGAKAYFELEGPTGLKGVNLRDDEASQGVIPPGGEIPKGESLFDQVQESGEIILAEIRELVTSTNRLVGNVSEATDRVDLAKVDRILDETSALMKELGRTTRRIDQLVRDLQQPFTRTVKNADAAVERVADAAEGAERVLANVDRTVGELRSVVRRNDADLRASVRNLRKASESFDELGRELRNQPQRLLFGGAPPERELP